MLVLYTPLTCWLCDLHMQNDSHIYLVLHSYIELMLYIDNYYTHLPLYIDLYNLTNIITLW